MIITNIVLDDRHKQGVSMSSIIKRLNQMNNAIEIPIAKFLHVKQVWVSWAVFFIAYGSPFIASFLLNLY